MSKTYKPIATYSGGIYSLIEAAIIENGNIYIRFQDKDPRYGYIWGKWMHAGKVEPGYIPYTMQCGFSVLRKMGKTCNFRLPAEANYAKIEITRDLCDYEEAKYS